MNEPSAKQEWAYQIAKRVACLKRDIEKGGAKYTAKKFLRQVYIHCDNCNLERPKAMDVAKAYSLLKV